MVTIDNLDIKEHVRWAQDRASLDPQFISDSKNISAYSEVIGTSAIFPSQLKVLFNWEKGMNPWANFDVPANLSQFSKRFFSHRLFNWTFSQSDKERHQESDSDSDHQEEPFEDLIQRINRIKKQEKHSLTFFEKDKMCILSLLESIRLIDEMLAQITGRKLQYQKG